MTKFDANDFEVPLPVNGTGASALSPTQKCGKPVPPSAEQLVAYAAAFPDLWAALMHRVYGGDIRLIREDLPTVSESCARKWVNGEGGVRGVHMSVVKSRHPDLYEEIIGSQVP